MSTPHDTRVPIAALCALAALSLGRAADLYAQPSLFQSGVEMVPLTVTVTNASGKYVTGLTSDAFQILDEGVPQDVAFFAAGEIPIDLALVLDTSSSMNGDLPLVREAANGLVRTLERHDRCAVLAVSSTVAMPQGFTHDRASVASAIESVKGGGSTAVYDGLYIAVKELARQREDGAAPRRPVLVVLSDGDDNASHVAPEHVAEAAQRVGAQVYVVMMTTRPRPKHSMNALKAERSTFELRALARDAGGRMFKSGSVEELPAIYQAIAQELASQYDLAYVPRHTADQPAFRRVSVQLRPPVSGVARTRSGYFPEKAANAVAGRASDVDER
jgi:VWFA-related protein